MLYHSVAIAVNKAFVGIHFSVGERRSFRTTRFCDYKRKRVRTKKGQVR